MRSALPVLLSIALFGPSAPAAEQIVTLGDSLTFAYEAQFCFSQTINDPINGNFTIGDGFPLTVRNWIEILGDPTFRGAHFDVGSRDSLNVSPPFGPNFVQYFRQEHNWAIPGLKIDGMRRFLTGEATFRDLLDEDPGYSTMDLIFDNSDYDNSDFALSDLQAQIQNTAERMVIFVGGNDIRPIYETVYNGGSAGTFVADFMADMTAILDIVQGLNPTLPIVIVNVPHVGITQIVRESYPFDVVKTGRISALLRDLNSQLETLAGSRSLGYADIYTPTLQMTISSGYPLTIHGSNFANQATTVPGAPTPPAVNYRPVWLNGPLSGRFHPNTSAQALVANEIIHAFNRRYQTGIPPLTATEMLVDLLGITAGSANPAFTTWFNAYFVGTVPAPAASPDDDSDGDGIPAGVEFALGLNPELKDASRIATRVSGGLLEIAYPVRLPVTTRFTLVPEASSTLQAPFTPLTPAAGTDGLSRASIPVGPGRGFIRLRSEIP